MSWRQVLRALEVDARRHRRQNERSQRASERASIKTLRELERQHRAYEKAEAAERAATEAATFENYLNLIVSVHKDCGAAWDWAAHVRAPSPSPPAMQSTAETLARRAQEAYRPGFFARVFGGEKKQRALLEQRLVEAKREDARAYVDAGKEHQSACEKWQLLRDLGTGVLAMDLPAYRKALEYAAPFGELATYNTTVSISDLGTDAAVLVCEITDPDVVPNEEVRLTTGGKLSTKAMAASRYWSLYQDYVCSCALRVARETFAVLPVARSVVSVGTRKLDTSTGHPGVVTLLTTSIFRGTLERLNLDAVDPSDAMKNFPHRMKFKKISGFEAVDPISLEENWVSAG